MLPHQSPPSVGEALPCEEIAYTDLPDLIQQVVLHHSWSALFAALLQVATADLFKGDGYQQQWGREALSSLHRLTREADR